MSIETILIAEGASLLFKYISKYVSEEKPDSNLTYATDDNNQMYLILGYAVNGESRVIVYSHTITGQLHYITLEEFDSKLQFV